MPDKEYEEPDYQQCRNDVAAALAAGALEYEEKTPKNPINVSLDMIAACKRVKDSLRLRPYLSVRKACGREGISRYSYFYARDNGLI